MEKQSVGLKIFLLLESVVTVRVLLFTLPVFINDQLTRHVYNSPADGLIVLLTLACLMYLTAGCLSLLEIKGL